MVKDIAQAWHELLCVGERHRASMTLVSLKPVQGPGENTIARVEC